jgi:hypothetical protein
VPDVRAELGAPAAHEVPVAAQAAAPVADAATPRDAGPEAVARLATGRAARARGRLRVSLLPYAEVTVDGVPVGRTPVDIEVSSGRHIVGLTNPDTGQVARREVRVSPRQLVWIKSWQP